MDRAQVYATALGVEIGSGGNASPGNIQETETNSQTSGEELSPAPALLVTSEEVVDYNQRYDEQVLGVRSVNWGNVILVVMIAAIAFGGGAYVWFNERKLRGLPFVPGSTKTVTRAKALDIPQIEGYSPDVLALLPQIEKLNPLGLQALKRLLENPDQASEMLHSMSRIDPELIKRIRNLDRESRALLLALSGD
jgi:hypothetical protein